MKKLHIAMSPLSGKIFVGHILRDGCWGTGKEDLTIEAIDAVCQYVLRNHEGRFTLWESEGVPEYEIQVLKCSNELTKTDEAEIIETQRGPEPPRVED